MPGLSIGVVPSFAQMSSPRGQRMDAYQAIEASGVDHLGLVDHVAFRGGHGYDGLVHAGVALALLERMPVYVGVYLLPLRHPVPVARQLSTLAELAPGRLTLAVGVGGDDRDEVRNCGVDPGTRGRRTDEYLAVLRRLATGEAVTYAGDHVDVADCRVLPAPSPAVPLVVGGRSAAAVRRVSSLGDGWLALWVSPERFAATVAEIATTAASAGRDPAPTQHGLTVWCGFGETTREGRRHLASAMEETYATPFASFSRWCPCGTPQDVAQALKQYVDAGCTTFNLMPRAGDDASALSGAAEVARLLRQAG